MPQGRVIGSHLLTCAVALLLSFACLSTASAAPPAHANNDKQKATTDQSKTGNGRWATSSNSAPTISGVPDATVLQDRTYDFLPSADDPDGDLLSFRVSNLPRWATFDTTSGRLSGKPSLGDIGLYSDIVIAVSDGQASTELPAFGVEVVASATGAVTLSWVAPTENTDGSPLLDLAGYEVHWGPQSGTYLYSADISNPGITTYMIENLTDGTYYFAIKATNSEGVASTFSNEALATIVP